MSMSSGYDIKLKNINIKKFRKLKDISIDIAERITVIAGHNGIGKSTIIGLIANGSELKRHKSYFDRVFQSKFGEIFHLDPEKDYTKDINKKYDVIFNYLYDNDNIFKYCTVTKHKEKNKNRLRIVARNCDEKGKQINSKVKDIGDSAKVPIPTLYIGMSRVIPIGESKDEHYSLSYSNIMEKEDIEYMNKCFEEVIGKEEFSDEKVNKQYLKHSTKKSFGPCFKNYSFRAISLGQDTLSTIITALVSFKKLKRELKEKYSGGILVIDEIDACLHPLAQERIINILDKASKDFDIQIVVTSHSLTVIKEILFKKNNTMKNPKDKKLYYNIAYIQDTCRPNIMNKPNYKKIKNDMFLHLEKYKNRKQDVKLYFEDREALFFFEQLLKNSEEMDEEELNFCKIDLQVCCDILSKLPEKDSYFKKVVIILDGDVNTSDKYKERINNNKNMIALPGMDSPEVIIIEYLTELINNTEHIYWRNNEDKITVQIVNDAILKDLENDLNGIKDEKKIRERNKNWFNKYKEKFEETELITYWMNDNIELVKEFTNDFNEAIKFIRGIIIKNDE